MPRKTKAWAGIVAGLASVALTPAQAAEAELPPYTAAYEPRTPSERGLWMQADEYERQLQNSPLLLKDQELEAYVRTVLCNTVGADRCQSVRIYVMEIPAFNATMTANGTLQVWTGLLLRVRSEAELGAILGHEFAHFELRHSLNGAKARQNGAAVLAWVQVLGGIANTSTYSLQTTIVGSIFQYGREQEQEADLLGVRYLANSPYPSAAAAETWRHLIDESDATAVGRRLRPSRRYTAGFFDSHPTDRTRLSYLAEAADKYGDAGDPQAEGHARAIAGIFPRLLAAQMQLNDFGGSEYLLGEFAQRDGWTPALLIARADMYRLRGNPRDLVTAAQFYREALQAGPQAPEVHRNLGLSLLRAGQSAEAKPELQRYLELAPAAEDAAVIQTLLNS